VKKFELIAKELPVEILVEGANESPTHHSCETVDAPEKVPGAQEIVEVLALADVGKPTIDGAIVERGLLGWLTVKILLDVPFEFTAVTVQVNVLELPELFSETTIEGLEEPNGTPAPLQAIVT